MVNANASFESQDLLEKHMCKTGPGESVAQISSKTPASKSLTLKTLIFWVMRVSLGL